MMFDLQVAEGNDPNEVVDATAIQMAPAMGAFGELFGPEIGSTVFATVALGDSDGVIVCERQMWPLPPDLAAIADRMARAEDEADLDAAWSDPGPFFVLDGAKAIGNRSPHPQNKVLPFQTFAEAETYATAFCEAYPAKVSGVTIQGAYHLLRAIREDGTADSAFSIRWARAA